MTKYLSHRSLILTVFTTACASQGAPTGDIEPQSEGATLPLYGETRYAGCTTQQSAVFDRGVMFGRVVSSSRAYQQCLEQTVDRRQTITLNGRQVGPYTRCGAEQTATSARMLEWSRTSKDLDISCVKEDAPNIWARAGTQTPTAESFSLRDGALATAASPNPDMGWLAGTMWHEVMHDYGLGHDECGWPAGTNMHQVSAPYIASYCIAGIIDESARHCAGQPPCTRGLRLINQLGAAATCECVADPRPWSPWFDVAPPGSAANDVPVATISTVAGGLSTFWTTASGAVRSTYFDPRLSGQGWQAPFDLAGPGAAARAARVTAVSSVPGGTSLFWVGPDGSVRTMYFEPRRANPTWSGVEVIATAGAADARSRIAALTEADGSTRLYWLAADGSVRSTYFETSAPQNGWAKWFVLAGPGNARGFSLAAASPRARGTQLFWFGPDGGVGSMFYDPAAARPAWSQPFPLTPPGEADPDAGLAAISTKPGGLSVFWVGRSGAVRTSFFDPGVPNARWAGPVPLTGDRAARRDSDLAAISTVPGGTSLFWAGPNATVRSTYYDPREARPAWAPAFEIGKVGEAGRSVTAISVNGVAGSTTLFHTSSDGRVRSSYYDPRY